MGRMAPFMPDRFSLIMNLKFRVRRNECRIQSGKRNGPRPDSARGATIKVALVIGPEFLSNLSGLGVISRPSPALPGLQAHELSFAEGPRHFRTPVAEYRFSRSARGIEVELSDGG